MKGDEDLDGLFKSLPNNAKKGGSYREVVNASDLSDLFSNLGKTTEKGYAKSVASLPDNVSLVEGTTYTGTVTIRGITHTFTFIR